MNRIELIASLVDSMAWPVVVVVIAYWLRDSIVALAERISSVKIRDVEAFFNQTLEDIAPAEAEITATERLQATESKSVTLMELVDISPRVAILEAWVGIEAATRHYSKSHGLGKRVSYQGLRRLPKEHRQKIEHILTPYQELRVLRNRAAHSTDFDLTPQIARKYIDVATWVERVLNDASRDPQRDA